MSAQNVHRKKARRPSSILKKVISDENDVTSVMAMSDTTQQLKNPASRRLSKRVSFSDANMIKVIESVKDIGQNWPDSLSDSSEAGVSCLADISNLTTPTIRKVQIEKSVGNVPKSFQNLLSADIINDGDTVLNETQGSCGMDISCVSATSKFSFFDNSKLGFGHQLCSDAADDSKEINEDSFVITSFYTRDFLQSLDLERKDKTDSSHVAEERRYPHVNPPSYKECIEGASGKSIVPAMDTQTGDQQAADRAKMVEDMDFTAAVQTDGVQTTQNMDSGDMDLTCATISAVQPPVTGLETLEQNCSMSSCDSGGMEFTCAAIPSTQKIFAELGMGSENVPPPTITDDMELTCSTIKGSRKLAMESGLSCANTSSTADCDDMDFTCAVQGAVTIPAIDKNNVKSCHSDSDDLPFTGVLQPSSAAQSVEYDEFQHEKVEALPCDERKTEDMEFTCAVPSVNLLMHGTPEQNEAKKEATLAECGGGNLTNSNKEVFLKELQDDGMDITCMSAKVDMINHSHPAISEHVESMEEPIGLADSKDVESSTEIVECDNDAPKHRQNTIIIEQSVGDVDLTLLSTKPRFAKKVYDCQAQVSEIPTVDTPEITEDTKPISSTLDFGKSVGTDESRVTTFSSNDREPYLNGSEASENVTNPNQPEIPFVPSLPSTEMIDQPLCCDSNQQETAIISQKEYSGLVRPTGSNQIAVNVTDDSEELEFASPLKKRLHKIRNSIGLYKAMQKNRIKQQSRCTPESVKQSGDNGFDEDYAGRRPKYRGILMEEQKENEIGETESPKAVSESETSDYILTSTIQPQQQLSNQEVEDEQTTENQDAEFQPSINPSLADVNEQSEGFVSVGEIGLEKTQCDDNSGTQFDRKGACEKDADAAEGGHDFVQADASGFSVSLHKSVMEDICQESITKEENITVQEFLQVYTEINIAHLKRSGLSVVLPAVKLQVPTNLCDMFEARYWMPREVAIREACVDLMKKKIEWLEESVAKLDKQFHASNPEVFHIIRSDPEGNTELIQKLQKLATNCKSLGKAFWKRDVMKLHKGLNKELKTYLNENLLPVTQELEPCKELLDKTLQEMEEEDRRVEEILVSKPSPEQEAQYIECKTELDLLKSKYQESVERVEAHEEKKSMIRKRRNDLIDRQIVSGFTMWDRKERRRRKSLSELQSSAWKLCRVKESSLEFSFLSDSIIFTVSFEESPSWEWERKITSFSLDGDLTSKYIISSDVGFYKILHKLWKRILRLDNLVAEYSNLAGLKNLLEVLSNLLYASRDLLDDIIWINCRLVCETCPSVEDTSITVSFLSPQPGVDGFLVKFSFEDDHGTNGDKLDSVLRVGFVPTSHECITGKRCLDHLGKEDIDCILNNLEPGSHYLKRAVDAVLKQIEYKYWS